MESPSLAGIQRRARGVSWGAAAVVWSLVLGYLLGQRAVGGGSSTHFFVFAVAVPALAVALLRPTWPLLAFVAIPPGVLAHVGSPSVKLVIGVLVIVLLIHHQGRKTLFVGGGLPALALLVVCVFALLDRVRIGGPLAIAQATYTRDQFLLYLVILVAAYTFVRNGELAIYQVAAAFCTSGLLTFAILLGQTHGSPHRLRLDSTAAPANPGWDFHRTHFGYLMAACFGIAFAGYLLAQRRRGLLLTAALVLGIGVFISFSRGAWLAATIALFVLPPLTGRRGYWLLAPIPVVLAATVSVVRARLLSDLHGGLSASYSSGQLGTGRLLLWDRLWHRAVQLPWGHGFGYIWSVSPEQLGLIGYTTLTNGFIYAHNDFLYWMIELGLVGLIAWLVLWFGVWRYVVTQYRAGGEYARWAMIALGPVVTMFIATNVDNGIHLSDLALPFFALVGALSANAWRLKQAERMNEAAA